MIWQDFFKKDITVGNRILWVVTISNHPHLRTGTVTEVFAREPEYSQPRAAVRIQPDKPRYGSYGATEDLKPVVVERLDRTVIIDNL